ncbi:MAG TPA: FliH/SctL family protein, partial [Polyangiaceae bacterium]|nr:FliH/SctL family protein [Polyangiaceae bacterium]
LKASAAGATVALRTQSGVPTAHVLSRHELLAKARAEEIVQAAQRRAAEIQLQAAARGRALGLAELSAQQIALAERQRRQNANQLDRSVEIAKLLAELLIQESLKLDEQLVGRLAAAALQRLTTRSALRLSINPEDQSAVAARLQELDIQAVALIPTPTLGRGEFRIESDLGSVESRIDGGLERLAQRLRSLLNDGE